MAHRLQQIWMRFEKRSDRDLSSVGMEAKAMPEIEEEVRGEDLLPPDFQAPAAEAMKQLKAVTDDLKDKKGRRSPEKTFSEGPPVEAISLDRQFEETDMRTRRRQMDYQDWLLSNNRAAYDAMRRPRKKFLGIF
ncbi:MAG: hypothetical protein AAGC95_16170 [Pseudomonadota bacterium]